MNSNNSKNQKKLSNKSNYLSLLIVLTGIVVLFFFPEPETNFFAYVITALFFLILFISSRTWKKRNKF